MTSVQWLVEVSSIIVLPPGVADEVLSFFKPVKICTHEPNVTEKLSALEITDLKSNFRRLLLMEVWLSYHPFIILFNPDLPDDIREDVITCQMNRIEYLPTLSDVYMNIRQIDDALFEVRKMLGPNDWRLKHALLGPDVDMSDLLRSRSDIKKEIRPYLMDIAYGACRSEAELRAVLAVAVAVAVEADKVA